MSADVRVMVFCPCYLPGFRRGGPVRSVANMVKALADEFAFHIVTLDRDRGNDAPYPDIQPGAWQARGDAQVLYLAEAALSVRTVARAVAEIAPSLICLNGFFDPIFTHRVLAARRLGLVRDVPVLLAPQGEFSPGALSLKRTKKTAFIHLARLVRLHKGVHWQASTEMEREEILAVVPTIPPDHLRVAADLTDDIAHTPPRLQDTPDGVLRVCFLSRLSPKTNLDYALQVLAGVTVPVEFTIYGPIDDEAYWAACRQLMGALPPHVRAAYAGEVHPINVRETLAAHDVFFLPTRGENFGHVIYEALSAGLPVLISDQTPWQQMEARQVGWSLPLEDPAAFARVIEDLSRRSPDARQAAALRAHAFAVEQTDRPAAIARTRDLLRSLSR